MFKKARIILLLVIVATFAFVAPIHAQILWYNGDFNGYGSLTNGIVPFLQFVNKAMVYDDFLVGGDGWLVNEVWSNNLIWSSADINAFNQAYWEIRSGISTGNGGTLIASGWGSVTPTATGNSWYGLRYEYTIKVSGLDVALNPGSYWLAVAPYNATSGIIKSGISTTIGASAIGVPGGDNQNSFLYWPDNYNFTPTPEYLTGAYHDYSMGIGGMSREVVPEPSSLLLMGFGSIIAAFIKRRHKT